MRKKNAFATAAILTLMGSLLLSNQNGGVVQSLFPAALADEFPLARPEDDGPVMSWIEKTKHKDVFVRSGFCSEELWEVLWSEAKAGDLEARAILFFFMIPPPHIPRLTPPGSTGDLVSRKRDIAIMAVHSQAYDGPFERGYRDLAYDQFVSAGFDYPPGTSDFMKCVKASGDNCADIAVKAGLVPSFEDFAKQIDAMAAAGMKSTCE